MAGKALFFTITVSLLLVALYVPYWKNNFQANLRNVLDGLLYQERRYKVNTGNRVAVGFGSCWDVVTDGVDLMNLVGIDPPYTTEYYDVISTKNQLAGTFAYFFQNGAAAERYVSSKELFNKLVEAARGMNVTTENLGGNAPVMAQRLSHEGWDVLLASKMSTEVASALHSSVTLSSGTSNETADDVHLILEYDLGKYWGDYTTPRANRFIVHSDTSNMLLETLDGFKDTLLEFNPDLLVVGGLQLLDNFVFDPKVRTERLKRLESLLRSLPKGTKVHFEMASFVEQRLLEEIVEYVIPYADSMGMNEQELANLYHLFLYNNLTYATDHNPRVAVTLDQARVVYKALQERRKDENHYTTRLHIHTLAYQAIFTDQNGGWKHTRSAAAKAALMANRHVCASSYIDLTKAKLIMDDSFSVSRKPSSARVPLTETDPVSCWYEEQVKVCVAPNLVCTAIYKTASAGDNISAAGLSLQV